MQGYTYSTFFLMVGLLFIANIKPSESVIFDGFKIPCVDTSPQCMKDSIQAVLPEFIRGIPSLGIAKLDPFKVNKVNMEFPGGFTIEFKEGQSKGLQKCIIDSASVNGEKYYVTSHCNFTIKGKYSSHGKILMFPIDGEGDATILCKHLKFQCSFKLGTVSENGEQYLRLKEYDVRHSYEGQVYYKISNLFKGNPEISNMVLNFMNQNWLAVAKEFGDPIVNYGIELMLKNVEKLFKIVPKDQLFKMV